MLDQRNSPKLLIGITGSIVALIMLFLAYQWFFATSNEPLPPHQMDVEVAKAKPSTVAPAQMAEPASEAQSTANPATTVKLIDETILKTEVSENPSLAKEEIAKLEDIQKQLLEQEKLLNQQHKDADQLLALKEQQIKLLEAQLTQAN